ncbi:LLM class flavin-dependent oxidoreductase [Pseudonocardia parietis]|uniref:Alkanesulfonate monooxygenase SsuD/methylene tetrahydromethanopterin reductase-like flavin-dependent oxidoreductase (Luciferase family) n=1 Tax=Pseudonocardia parietis TaxID=570936 RepID=A0ABS4VV31_9PSEU|nr:LLM class flavin-dependent oxidoreductase [Pseudonocardia parietis]MBP2367774.1 alkanesulfonate monooxygenase SsuD/methylene tetrahydromethanopterin reductase-like flavin-dependent oxidoreductase (luciferase family) [Pseudonocardia parietis]
MRFGLVCPIQDVESPLDVLLDQLRAEVRAADEAGFDAFFLPEFHQTRGGGIVSPLLTGAALAEGTRRIRVGQAVVPAPLHHPVRLAEDVAMTSWLTRGRAMLGVGVGHLPADFRLYGVDRDARFDLLRDLLDVVDAAWSGEPFDVTGRTGRWQGHVTPAPYGGRRPEVIMGSHGPRGLALAARRADLWLSDPQRHVDVVAQLAATVRAEAARAGREVGIGMFRDAWIGESRAACEKVWLPHAMAVHRLYFNVGVYLPEFEPWVRDVGSRADFTPQLVAPGRFLYGTGEELRAEITDWRARTGADYLALRMRQPGGPGHEATLEAIARFGAEVIGPLQDRTGKATT